MNSDTDTQASPYAEFLTQLHEQPLEDGPTIRLEVEPAQFDHFQAWLKKQFALISQYSTWHFVGSDWGCLERDPDIRCIMAEFHDKEDGFDSLLTVLLVPIHWDTGLPIVSD